MFDLKEDSWRIGEPRQNGVNWHIGPFVSVDMYSSVLVCECDWKKYIGEPVTFL